MPGTITAPAPATLRPSAPLVKNPVGAPATYRPEFAHLAEKYCEIGGTIEGLGKLFQVKRETIYDWIATRQEFADAVNSGRDAANSDVQKSLFKRATGYTYTAQRPFVDKNGREHVVSYEEHVSPDTAAAIIWLKNRMPEQWRDKIDVSHNANSALLKSLDRFAEIFERVTQQSMSGLSSLAALPSPEAIDAEFSETGDSPPKDNQPTEG